MSTIPIFLKSILKVLYLIIIYIFQFPNDEPQNQNKRNDGQNWHHANHRAIREQHLAGINNDDQLSKQIVQEMCEYRNKNIACFQV